MLCSEKRDVAKFDGKGGKRLLGGLSAADHEVNRRGKTGAVSAGLAVDQQRVFAVIQKGYQEQ